MAENWKADADGILIFVRLSSHLVLHTNSIAVDRFILRRCRVIDLSVDSRYSTELAGHFKFLPCEYLCDSCRPTPIKFNFPSYFSTFVFSTNLCGLGEWTVVLELGNQSYLCSACDPATAMGTKISQAHSVALQSTQASTNSCVLC